MLETKIISSLEKAFVNGDIDSFDTLERISILKNERLSFQLAFFNDGENAVTLRPVLSLSGNLADFATVRQIMNVAFLAAVYFITPYTPWGLIPLLVGAALGSTLTMFFFTYLLVKEGGRNGSGSEKQ